MVDTLIDTTVPSQTNAPADYPEYKPAPGAPLSGQGELLPPDVFAQAKSASANASPVGGGMGDGRPTGTGVAPVELIGQVAGAGKGTYGTTTAVRYNNRLTDLMDAPARAALNMPNGLTAHKQARAHRRAEDVMTPEFEIDKEMSSSEELARRPTDNGGFSGVPATESTGYSRSPSPNFLISGLQNSSLLRRILIERSASPNQHLTRPTFPPPSLSTYAPQPPRPLSFYAKIHLLITQIVSLVISTAFLLVVVAWAVSLDMLHQVPRFIMGKKPDKTFPWDDAEYWRKNENVSKDPRDYARAIGMDMEHQTVETEDGYYLRVNRVIDPDARPGPDGRGGFPVLILHGLFQSSGSFITSEERSLAFWLAKQGGYQVYLGNTRGVFGMGHRNFSQSDPRFWDWTIRELAMYDLPALVEHVCQETGYDKIAFIGHSQGNGLAFISLSLGMCPDLGRKLSLFVALAPAVYAGPLTSGFPFTMLNKMEWKTWKRVFGVLDFIPIMRWSYDYAPAKLFASLGYIMFAFLFQWTDANWLHRRKTKMFRFTPTPVSSASIFWWCGKGGFAHRGCTMDDSLDRWFDKRFPPLSIYHGGRDFLVLTDPLLDRLNTKDTDVEVIRVEKLDASEHCDFYWAAEAVEWVYESLREDIEKTRPRTVDERTD